MVEVVVYLKSDYSINESIWVDKGLTKSEIRKIVDGKYASWYSYDILSDNKKEWDEIEQEYMKEHPAFDNDKIDFFEWLKIFYLAPKRQD